jgi:hypothetical protein
LATRSATDQAHSNKLTIRRDPRFASQADAVNLFLDGDVLACEWQAQE